MSFQQILTSWYRKNKRDLPWRSTTDPYKIWLSEVILQQTRVEQGLPYYIRFTEKYPSLESLAGAGEEDVLRLWQGLGYYARARNMLQAARQMLDLYQGFGKSYDDLISLKGIGDYTASAVSSIAFNEPHAVVDGNVYRFLSRFFGISLPVDSSEGRKHFKELAQSLLLVRQPGEFNQAMMEMGAVVCKPAPVCTACPFAESCYALRNNAVKDLPVKSKKAAVRERFFYYVIMGTGRKIYIKKRLKKDIWQGLYDFPLIELKCELTQKQLFKTEEWQSVVNEPHEVMHFSKQYRHQLSHQTLKAHFVHVKLKSALKRSDYKAVSASDFPSFGMPRLIEKYVKDALL